MKNIWETRPGIYADFELNINAMNIYILKDLLYSGLELCLVTRTVAVTILPPHKS
jgi:hypothetical protein